MTDSLTEKELSDAVSSLSRRRMLRLVIGGASGLAAVVLLDACGASSPAASTGAPVAAASKTPSPTPRPIEKVVYMGDFALNGTSSPVFLAKERGYYREQGIDLEIQPGTGSANTAKIVGAGTAQVGRVDGGVLISSVAQKLPIKAVAGLEGTSPLSIIVKSSSTMKTPKDLEGKKIAGTPGGSQEVLFPAWMKKNGADATKVEIVSSTAATRRTFMLQGQVDAMFGLTYSELHVLKAGGLDARPILFADFGLNVPGKTFVANNDFLKAKPDLVRGFVAATMKGYAEAKKDPKAAIDAFVKDPAAQTLNPSLELQTLELELPLLSTKRTAGKPLGYMDSADWSDAIDALAEIAAIPSKPSLTDLFTNDFVPTS
jgi:NitT/TauT family transport system substrate-binding protein